MGWKNLRGDLTNHSRADITQSAALAVIDPPQPDLGGSFKLSGKVALQLQNLS